MNKEIIFYKKKAEELEKNQNFKPIENLDENIIKKTMLFFMKDSILPLWESEDNINGGCFSYKINNINIVNIFKILLYKIIGNTLSTNETTLNNGKCIISICLIENNCNK